eukprot:scaffold212140_cov12-Tisochrysis_lutea.AAC.1
MPASCKHAFLCTWVAVLLALQTICDAQEGAIALGAGVAQVIQALGLHPSEEQQLGEDEGAWRWKFVRKVCEESHQGSTSGWVGSCHASHDCAENQI